MKTICGLALGAVVVGCHLDKLLGGSGGGSPPPSHGTPVGLSFTSQPRTVQAGQPIGPVRVSVVDSAGQPVAGVDTTTVFVALGTNPGGATLHGDTSTHPVNGVATFTSLSLDNAGHGYTLTARAAGLTQPSAPFDIMPPPPTTGNLTVTTSTGGSDVDPDGYTVTVDGDGRAIPTNSSGITFSGLAAGPHTVALSGVASNCAVSGANPRTLSVTAGQTMSTTFSLSCTPLPPTTGNLTVTTSTGGSDVDPDGYTVTVDGTDRPIPTNSSGVTFTGLAAGPHTVALSGVASNCSVSGSNPRNADVPAGGVGRADFLIRCTALPPPQNHAPIVNAGGDQTILLSLGSVTVNASFTDQDHDGPWSYTIDWDDNGAVNTGTKQNEGSFSASHSYGLVSTHTVTVTVTDSHGLSGSDQAKITVVLFLTPRP